MMTFRSQSMIFTLAALTALLDCTFGENYGAELADRSYEDPGRKVLHILGDRHGISEAGVLSSWKYYASRTGSFIQMIWRPESEDGTFSLVASEEITVSSVGVGSMSASGSIAVQPGDLLGIYWTTNNPVPYDFDSSCSNHNPTYALSNPSGFTEGESVELAELDNRPCRTYSIAVEFETGPAGRWSDSDQSSEEDTADEESIEDQPSEDQSNEDQPSEDQSNEDQPSEDQSDGDQSDGIELTDEQTEIVDRHNHWRSLVNPSASNMLKMHWDEALAAAAQAWANGCAEEHDDNDARSEAVGYGVPIGQNLAMFGVIGQGSWTEGIDSWDAEKYNLVTFGSESNGTTGHYTQVVQHHATHVGCGFSECPDAVYKEFYVCNYMYGQMDFLTPYSTGQSCSACSTAQCVNNMCDCGDNTPICKNGGTFNTNACECDCAPPFTGTNCEDVNCPEDDESYCTSQFLEDDCELFEFVRSSCPYMCNLCQ